MRKRKKIESLRQTEKGKKNEQKKRVKAIHQTIDAKDRKLVKEKKDETQ